MGITPQIHTSTQITHTKIGIMKELSKTKTEKKEKILSIKRK